MKKRLLSILVVMCLLFSALPIPTIAADTAKIANNPQLLDLTVSYYDNQETKEISLLQNTVPEIAFPAGRELVFKAVFSEPDRIGTVYIESTKGNETKYLEAFYNEGKNAFITSGFFDEDPYYIPGAITVKYTKNTDDVKVTDSIDWTSLNFESITDEMVTVLNHSDTSTQVSIELTDVLGTVNQVLINTSIDIFDETTGGNLDEFLGTFKELEKLASYTVKGVDDKTYLLYLDYSDPNTYAMIIHDVSGNKFIKSVFNSTEKLRSVADSLADVNTVSGLIYDFLSIQKDMDQLRTEIRGSSMSDSDKTDALSKTYALENDQKMFSLATTVFPVIVAAAAVSSPPAILFSALLSMITSSASYFWDYRVGMIQSELVVLDFAVTGSCGDNLTWTIDIYGTLRISGTGPMRDYFAYPSVPWSRFHQQIKSLMLEPGITRIGDYAFSGQAVSYSPPTYPNFTGPLVLPDSVTSIGDHAFSGCSGLTGTLRIPDGVTTIGRGAFSGCTGFTGDLYIPNSVTEVGEWAFDGCSGFDGNLTLSNSLTRLEYRAFSCKNLQGELIIPDSVTYIGVYAFYEFGFDRFGFRSLKLGKNVEVIDSSAFANCVFESPIYIPASVKTIGNEALHFDSSTDIYFEGDAPSIDKWETGGSFRGSSDITLYYIPGRIGWIDSDAYNAEKGTWNGYKLLPWEEEPCKHEYNTVIVDPTCTERGYTTYTCAKCGNSYIDNYTSALGHSYGEWVVTTPATATTSGQQERVCSQCGDTQTSNIPATGGGSSGNQGSSDNDNSGSTSNGGTTSNSGSGSSSSSDSSTDTSVAKPETSGDTTTVDVTTSSTISGTTANTTISSSSMNQAVNSAVSEAAKQGTAPVVEVEVKTPSKADSLHVSLPTSSLKTLAKAEDASLVIISNIAEVVLDHTALGALVSQATSNTVVLEVAPVVSSSLTVSQREAVGTASVVDLCIVSGRTVIHNYNNGVITVTLPYELPSGQSARDVVVYYLEDNGSLTSCATSYANGKVTFTTIHLSKYVIGNKELVASNDKPVVTDVAISNYYYDAVLWAVENGITFGITDTTFGPDAACTRAQIVSFLWHQAGSPKMSGMNPFMDVSATDYYYDAVLWAVENGITAGTGDGTTFSPSEPCTRAQAMTFLYRDKNSPASSGTSGFTDVSASAYYANAIQWAVANGVTYGVTDTFFGSDQNCTRAQIVSFMYRARAN